MPTETKEMPIEVAVAENPAIVLLDGKKRIELYEHCKREVESHEPDLSTVTGRKAIAALAYKVTRTKTAIDDAGKKLNAKFREQINVVDESRRAIRAEFEALAEQARKPLTEWEQAEEKRVLDCTAILQSMRDTSVVTLEDTAETVESKFAHVSSIVISKSVFLDDFERAEKERDGILETLAGAKKRLEREESERAELERLRKEAAAREEADRLAREKAEAEKAEAARVEAEKKRAEAAAKAEAERIAKAKEEAASQAKAEAERKHAEEVAKMRREIEAAGAKQRAEAKRIADEEAKRKAEAERKAAEEAKRAADQKHRKEVMALAAAAIQDHGGVDEEAARKIVLAITGGNVPNVIIRF